MKRATWKMFTATIRYHVHRSNIHTADAVIEREVREALATFRASNHAYSVSKATENACVKYALKCHNANRAVYRRVMYLG